MSAMMVDSAYRTNLTSTGLFFDNVNPPHARNTLISCLTQMLKSFPNGLRVPES